MVSLNRCQHIMAHRSMLVLAGGPDADSSAWEHRIWLATKQPVSRQANGLPQGDQVRCTWVVHACS